MKTAEDMYMRVLTFTIRTTLFCICAYLYIGAFSVLAQETEVGENIPETVLEESEAPAPGVTEDTPPSPDVSLNDNVVPEEVLPPQDTGENTLLEPVVDTEVPPPVTPSAEEPPVTDMPAEVIPEEVLHTGVSETILEEYASATEKITEVQIPVPLPEDEAYILEADTYGSFGLIEQPVFILHAEQPFLEAHEETDDDTEEHGVVEDVLSSVDTAVDAVVEIVEEVIEVVVDATTAAATFVTDAVLPAEEVSGVLEEEGEVLPISNSTNIVTTTTDEVAVATDTETEVIDIPSVEVSMPDAPYTVRVLVDGYLCTHMNNLQNETTLEITIATSCMTPGTHQAHIEVEAEDTIYVWEGEFVWGGEVVAVRTLSTAHALTLIVSPEGSAALWLRESVGSDTLYTFLEARSNTASLPPIGMEGETILWVADAQNTLIGFDMLSRTTFSQSLEKRRADTEISLHETWYTVQADAHTVTFVPVSSEETP